jgi:hypothetical protein
MTFPEDDSTNTPPIERTDGLGTAQPNPIVPSAKEDNSQDPLPSQPSTVVPFHVDDKTRTKYQSIMKPSMLGVNMSRQRPVPVSRTLPIRFPHAVPVQQARDPLPRQGHHPDQWGRASIGTYTPSSTVQVELPNPTVHQQRQQVKERGNSSLDHEPAPGMQANEPDGRVSNDVIVQIIRTQDVFQEQLNRQTQSTNQVLTLLQQLMERQPVPPRAVESNVEDNPFHTQSRTHVRDVDSKPLKPDPSAKRRIVLKTTSRKTSGISENDLDAGASHSTTVATS